MYFAKKFELFAEKDLLPTLFPQSHLTGRWWHKTEEIDLLARKIEGKKALREKGYLAFDLEDFEKALS